MDTYLTVWNIRGRHRTKKHNILKKTATKRQSNSQNTPSSSRNWRNWTAVASSCNRWGVVSFGVLRCVAARIGHIVWAFLGSGSTVISCVVRRSTDSLTMATGTIQEDQYSHVTNQLTRATNVREFRQSYGEKYLPWLSTHSVIRWVNGLNSLHLWFAWLLSRL